MPKDVDFKILTCNARFQDFSSWPISVSDSLQGYSIQHGSAQLSPYMKLTLQLNLCDVTSYKLGIAMYAWNTMISLQQTGYGYRPTGETLKRRINSYLIFLGSFIEDKQMHGN